MGLAVSEYRVEQEATRIGCEVLKAPFAYLDSLMGGSMSRIKSWEEIMGKMAARLSKWKMKTLSIGAMKYPSHMEVYRCYFFNGIELNSKKSIWVKWSNVLSSKEKGGLGVSSLYALNRDLMFKWVWRFTTQKGSLWASVIKAIHGVKKLGNGVDTSFWDDVWRGDTTLKQRFHRLYALELNKKIDVASKLSQESLINSFRRCPRSGVGKTQMIGPDGVT
ncbi:hypothetical protein Tco_0023998 [Tanacetum coccineum]